MEWTKEQAKAINTLDKSLLVSAGAGSGKTAVLTQRILNFILSGKANIDEIAVMTFTNAAALSMKNKIKKALLKEAKNNSNKDFIYSQLSLLENSEISTINSFCLRLVRKYYYVVDIDPSFSIIDEANGNHILNEIILKVLEKYYLAEDEAFLNLVSSIVDYKHHDNFLLFLQTTYYYLYNRPNPFLWLREKVEFFNNISKENILSCDAFKLLHKEAVESLSQAYLVSKETLNVAKKNNWGEKLISFLESDLVIFEETKTLVDRKPHMLFDLPLPKLNRKPPKKSLGISEEADEFIKESRDKAKELLKEGLSLSGFSLEDNALFLSSLYPTMKKLEEILIEIDFLFLKEKKSKGVAQFHDVEYYALKILEDEQIQKEIKESFKAVFVDEYQDSSLVQEEIFKRISTKDNLFTVGDVKQSIYSFRLAEPSLFLDRIKKYSNENPLNEIIYLNKNFRSNENLITSINLLFSLIMNEETSAINYAKTEALIPGRISPIKQKIEVKLIEKPIMEEDIDQAIIDAQNNELEALYIASLVNNLLKEEIYDNEKSCFRKVEYKDICILDRSMNAKKATYQKVFSLLAIPINADNSSNYYDLIEISMLTDYLKIISNFNDDIPLVGLMKGPFFNFSLDELLEISLSSSKYFFYEKVLNFPSTSTNGIIKEKINLMLNQIDYFRNKSKHSSLEELLTTIYEKTNYLDILSLYPNGEGRRENLLKLKEIASKYELFSLKGLHSFLGYIKRIKLTNQKSEIKTLQSNKNQVECATIHASKGLEYPIVILSNSNKDITKKRPGVDYSKNLDKNLGICLKYKDNKNHFLVDTLLSKAVLKVKRKEEMQEELRLFYVALTRAKERIILTSINSEENTAKLIEACRETLTNTAISKANSYLKWTLLALNNIKELKNEQNVYEDENFIVTKNKLISTNIIEDYKQNKQSENTNLYAPLINQIKEQLAFSYAYKNEINIPSKLSVSSLKEEKLLEVGKEILLTKDIPRFMEEETNLSPIKKGNLFHLAMENIDITKLKEATALKEEINNQLKEMEQSELLSKEEAKNLDYSMIEKFFLSDVGSQLLQAKKVYREKPFNIKLRACELLSKWENSKEDILIQGIIDCYFENEKGNIILLDYKTNRIDNNLDELIKAYEQQINTYAKAIEILLGKKVEKKYLYFTFNNLAIEV